MMKCSLGVCICLVAAVFLGSVPAPVKAAGGTSEPWEEEMEAVRATLASLQDEEARIRISGHERVRIMNVRSDADSTEGPYGETLRKGNSIRFRLGLKVEATVTRTLTAGGWLRLSNEGREILTRGPDYLVLERGSAFVRYSGEAVRMTCGYYPVHFTPLTLMRWDLEDNPQGGGSMACGVCGVSGLLSAESLEELGPALVFEGAKGEVSIGDVCDLTAFYANPNHVRDSLYHRDLWGTRASVHAYGPGTSRARLSATYLRADDDEKSLAGSFLSDIETELVGLDAEVQPVDPVTLTAEWARTHALKAFFRRHGEAYVLGGRVFLRRQISLSCHYIHIDPWFSSPYAALSYLANREGVRISAGWRSRDRDSQVTVFYKTLEEIGRQFGADHLRRFTLWGLGAAFSPVSGVRVEGNLVLDFDRRESPSNPWLEVDEKKTTAVVDLVYEFTSTSHVRLRYQATDLEDQVAPDRNDLAHLTSLLWSVEF